MCSLELWGDGRVENSFPHLAVGKEICWNCSSGPQFSSCFFHLASLDFERVVKVEVKSLSRVQPFATPLTVAH